MSPIMPHAPMSPAPSAEREAPSAAGARETVAVVIPTYNVAPIIDRCLQSVAWADEIIIVDMFSTDETVEICRRYPQARIFQRRDYIFANVNFGFDQARTDWVIRLDSDEVPNAELQQEIRRVLADPDPSLSAYLFPSVQYMFGEPMRYGPGLREHQLRKCMFRRGTARYACRSEHEEIQSSGRLGVLGGHYDHFTNHTVSEVVGKFNYYTDRDVERLDPRSLPPTVPWRIAYRGVRMFLLYYLQRKGYRDGVLGFFTSLFRGPIYLFIEEAKRWEKSRQQ